MAFPNRFLDDLRARVGLADVIQRHVKLTRKGREHIGLCPFHKEKTPSFTVNEEKGFYHCFGCGVHGDVISFAMSTGNLSFPEAVERLAEQAGLEVPRASPEEREREKKRASLFDVTEAACAWYEAQLRPPAGKVAMEYLTRRGLEAKAIAEFRLGYAPQQSRGQTSQLAAALRSSGCSEEMLLEAGLLVKPEDGREAYERFRNRVIFPIADRRGRIIAFGGRILGDGEPKYLNSPDTPLFHKGRVLYNLSRAAESARKSGELIVTEGYMDVIALARGGFPGAVAPLGTAVTEDQIREMWRLVDEPVMCFDGDTAGQRAAWRAAERALALLQPGKSLNVAFMPAGEDPDTLLAGQGAAAMRSILAAARPLVEVVWEMELGVRPVDTPERRADLETRIERRVRQIADRTVQQHYRYILRERAQQAFSGGRRDRRPTRSAKRPGRPSSTLPGAGAARRGGGLAAASVANRRRPQQILLAALVNHPALIDEFGEAFAGLEFDPDLDKFRQELHHIGASMPDLDAGALHRHLSESEFASVLDGLLETDVLRHGGFARSDASLQDAREGVEHTLALIHQRRREEEIRADARSAAAEGTKESEARFLEHQKDMVRQGEQTAELDDEWRAAGAADIES